MCPQLPSRAPAPPSLSVSPTPLRELQASEEPAPRRPHVTHRARLIGSGWPRDTSGANGPMGTGLTRGREIPERVALHQVFHL